MLNRLYYRLYLYYGERDVVAKVMENVAYLRDWWNYDIINNVRDVKEVITNIPGFKKSSYDIDKCRYQAIQFSPLADYLDIDNNPNIFEDDSSLLKIFPSRESLRIIRLLYSKGRRLVLDKIEEHFTKEQLMIIYRTISFLELTYNSIHLSISERTACDYALDLGDYVGVGYCRGEDDVERSDICNFMEYMGYEFDI